MTYQLPGTNNFSVYSWYNSCLIPSCPAPVMKVSQFLLLNPKACVCSKTQNFEHALYLSKPEKSRTEGNEFRITMSAYGSHSRHLLPEPLFCKYVEVFT